MSEPERPQEGDAEQAPGSQVPAERTGGDYAPSVAERLALFQRAGGIATPLLTAAFAFFVGGLVVLVTTGKNPLRTYQAIFDGSGLNWLFPWITSEERTLAAFNLQYTLLLTTPLILTGLAVAFAFRCGMFNIGGQGQYTVGAVVAVWVGSSFAGMAGVAHALLAIVLAVLAGALWAGIAGLLKATVGAHEVISTIMLNWIALWVGSFLFTLGGPLQDSDQPGVPVSGSVQEGAKLLVFWGEPELQGLHIGLFVAIGALVAFWVMLNRTTLGYEVRAVGFNPEAARYGGISVARNYFLAMAISGAFAGLAASLDVLGWQFRISETDVQISQIGFIGIAVALLGRNTAVGIGFAALLFGSLLNGASTRNLDPEIFKPELAGNLTLLIQGLIVLFVGADVLVLYLWQLRRRVKLRVARAGT
ncbi:MAG: ABC transporter permease [Actinobacteria bacterium]|nr:ABC transporter permease [Actinomycetota bacterium]